MSDVNAESLLAELEEVRKELYDPKGPRGLAAKALAEEESRKLKQIHDIVKRFEGLEFEEDLEEEVRDVISDMGYVLDMNTEYMELDLAHGELELWQNSYC